MLGGLFSGLGNKVVFTKDLIKVMASPKNSVFREELLRLYKDERYFLDEYVEVISNNPQFSKELGLILKNNSGLVVKVLEVLNKELVSNKDKLKGIDMSMYNITKFNDLLDAYIDGNGKNISNFLNIEYAQKVGMFGLGIDYIEYFKENYNDLLLEIDELFRGNIDFVISLKDVVSNNESFIKKMVYIVINRDKLVSEMSRVAKENPKLIENFGGLLNNNPLVITELMRVFK